jgi:hypothetical protein
MVIRFSRSAKLSTAGWRPLPYRRHVKTTVERVAGYHVDQPDVRAVGPVALAQHHPAKIVLADERDAPAMPRPDLRRDRALARAGVPAQHDEPG